MTTSAKNHDSRLIVRLENLTATDADFWSFRGNSQRAHGHSFFQYPAMMVPQMVGAIIDEILSIHPEIQVVGDPFAGSGTVLTESMVRGLGFWGSDINPLAVLLCRTKAGPFFADALKEKAIDLVSRIEDKGLVFVCKEFPNINKWFRGDVKVSLSKIHQAIRLEPSLWARRFFWVALAETVRQTSNSRTSTFKLHIRPVGEIEQKDFAPEKLFLKTIERNLKAYEAQTIHLKEKGFIKRGRYALPVEVFNLDVRDDFSRSVESVCDVIITSPPYGDNATTVPYGQHSYLPLQWIDLKDIGPEINSAFLSSTHAIDFRSLGGSKLLKSDDFDLLRQLSTSFSSYLESISNLPEERATRVAAFFRDLYEGLPNMIHLLGRGGLMVWVLGNRMVGGVPVPLDSILQEMLGSCGVSTVHKISREIVSKRMARKNSIADTMADETILIARKATNA